MSQEQPRSQAPDTVPASGTWTTCGSKAIHTWHQIPDLAPGVDSYCIGLREESYYGQGNPVTITTLG